jgi:hypothetical protein
MYRLAVEQSITDAEWSAIKGRPQGRDPYGPVR